MENAQSGTVCIRSPDMEMLESLKGRLRAGLFFPSRSDLDVYQSRLPADFATAKFTYSSAAEYIDAWSGATYERINRQLWSKSATYHELMRKADLRNMKQPGLTYYGSQSAPRDEDDFKLPEIAASSRSLDKDAVLSIEPPYCQHDQPGKIARVRKAGPNTGRLFFTCAKGKRKCKFFQWVDEAALVSKSAPSCPSATPQRFRLNNVRALTSYLNRNKINLHVGCSLVRKSTAKPIDENIKIKDEDLSNAKKRLFLKFSRQDQTLGNTRDDVWILSKSLNFEEVFLVKVLSNFISTSNELSVLPIIKPLPIDWEDQDNTYAIHGCKSTLEFTFLNLLRDQLPTLPILPYLLRCGATSSRTAGLNLTGTFNLTKEPDIKSVKGRSSVDLDCTLDDVLRLVSSLSEKYKLNDEQCSVLYSVAELLVDNKFSISPFVLMDGVSASGKTLLLSVAVILISEALNLSSDEGPACSGEKCANERKPKRKKRWKVLVASQTDVGVDCVLKKLLELGFDRFARVGDLPNVNRKVLPHAVHSRGGNEEHVKKLKVMLRKCPHSDSDRHYIQRSLDQALSGGTKRLLYNSLVVGTTCQDSLASTIGYYKFPVVILDEASSVPEPLALLPLMHFSCEKLIMAGDSKLQGPLVTEWGSSLFARIMNGGHGSFFLTTQYRCRPDVTSLVNKVVYDDTVESGSNEPEVCMVPGLPPICFFDVAGTEETSGEQGWQNDDEANFVADLIKLLLSHGVPGTSIVVMTTHEAQVQRIKSALQDIEFYDLSDVNCVRIDLVEKFVGCEVDVVILSNVRAADKNTQTACEVVNVLTRARNHVFIVANLRQLSTNERWVRAINHCKQQKSGIWSTFQFKQKFQKKIDAFLASDLASEIPLMAQSSNVTSVTSPAVGAVTFVDHDVTEDVSSSDSDDSIPLLRKKRRKILQEFEPDDDVIEEQSAQGSDRDKGGDACEDNTGLCESEDCDESHAYRDEVYVQQRSDFTTSECVRDDCSRDVVDRDSEISSHECNVDHDVTNCDDRLVADKIVALEDVRASHDGENANHTNHGEESDCEMNHDRGDSENFHRDCELKSTPVDRAECALYELTNAESAADPTVLDQQRGKQSNNERELPHEKDETRRNDDVTDDLTMSGYDDPEMLPTNEQCIENENVRSDDAIAGDVCQKNDTSLTCDLLSSNNDATDIANHNDAALVSMKSEKGDLLCHDICASEPCDDVMVLPLTDKVSDISNEADVNVDNAFVIDCDIDDLIGL